MSMKITRDLMRTALMVIMSVCVIYFSQTAQAKPNDLPAQPLSTQDIISMNRTLTPSPMMKRLRAHASLFLKVPRHSQSAWEGALWLYMPQSITFEAVDEMANALFYFRFNAEKGWILQSGEQEDLVDLPFSGKDLVAFLSGAAPIVPSTAFRRDGQEAGMTEIFVPKGPSWVFDPNGRLRSYTSGGRRAYRVDWLEWRESGRHRYPVQLSIHDVKRRYDIRLRLHTADIL